MSKFKLKRIGLVASVILVLVIIGGIFFLELMRKSSNSRELISCKPSKKHTQCGGGLSVIPDYLA